ncbi:hypothetical protein H6P81_005743 [Aristolochia fimbriata]|uniref:Uncharacterized protein n=1 Tax=Aristolochia fimbriata TaxID=158543 RepID=A0AAV7EWH1_ARIFI|nr:hypothetical protein H6P81_005743 [Aristolochia fimbriata]
MAVYLEKVKGIADKFVVVGQPLDDSIISITRRWPNNSNSWTSVHLPLLMLPPKDPPPVTQAATGNSHEAEVVDVTRVGAVEVVAEVARTLLE